MKKYLKILYFIVPILIGVLFANGLNMYLDHEIPVLMKQKDLMPIRNKFGDDLKSKGVVANDYFLNQGDIMFLGSSELRHVTLQHPSYFFNSGKSKNEAFIVGKEFNQDLQAATTIGSLDPKIKDKKVVFTFSFQWFLSQAGISNYNFSVRFSPIQFYQFLDNPEITPATKKQFAQQVYLYLRGSKDYQPEVLYAKMYGYDTISSKIERVLFYPYYVVHKFMIQLNGKGLLYKELKTLPKYKPESKKIVPWNWKKQQELAYEDGKRLSTNNPYGMLNSEYNQGFVDSLPIYNKAYASSDLMTSNEVNQYKLFLQVCKETGVKPIIVLMPGMNWFYNYIGVPKEERTKFFDYIQKLGESYGFTVLNYEQDDTKKYFLRDVAHLGTEGWTDVCEKVYNIYDQQ
ncbi:D-alanyl-lipoteichoic acid biosynthesis protein DltD [uncultured Clostridium sp.]|uniref:D-alanyl-lipoteichoic acid biosynthesis protein DltD n=1 Tax=uncultured Clostridium sp. TaxID=59620 RepID=UPI002609AD46|nr:D-alanyl-lipoteichoic acid biosynthesis protein DltD [uncultured Clostridium sp.]